MDGKSGFEIPEDLYYDRDRHLWVRCESTERVVVGIDALGLDSLGELAYVSLGEVGAEVARGGAIGSFEAAKMTSSLEAPVAGTLIERNDAVLADPLVVNRDPYGEGWLIAIAPRDWEADAAQLVSGDAIAGWVEDELRRRREEDRVG